MIAKTSLPEEVEFHGNVGNRAVENQVSTLTLFASMPSGPSEDGPAVLISGLFLLLGFSSLRKEGPVPTTGVAKLSGLGRVLLSLRG